MTTKVFVTYGFGSNLWNCYSEVDVPAEIDVRTYVFAKTLGKFAFMYSEEQWTIDGVTQQQLYNLEKVELQHHRPIISPTIEIVP